VAVRVTAGARSSRINGTVADADGRTAVKVAVTTIPEGGKANAALIKLLAKAWRLPKGALKVVATPVYDAPGCAGPDYCSQIVVRADDPARDLAELRGRSAAITHSASQSGYSALRATVAHLADQGRFFGKVVESGGHPNSLALVAAGEADVCATDSVTHALLARHRPEALEGLRVLTRSPAAPGLPYVTRAGADDDRMARLRRALFAALDDPGLASARAALLIAGAEIWPETAYQRIVDLERRAEELGYAQVA